MILLKDDTLSQDVALTAFYLLSHLQEVPKDREKTLFSSIREIGAFFNARVKKYLGDSELPVDLIILSSVSDSLKKLSDSDDAALVNMKELATNAILACREKWDSRKQIISSNLLGNYYSISESLEPLPAGPKLKATWDHFKDFHRFESYNNQDIQEFSDKISEWAALIDIIRSNEPRFLRQEQREETIASSLETILTYATEFLVDFENYQDITDEGDLDASIHDLDDLKWCLKRVHAIPDSGSEKIEGIEKLIHQIGYMQVGLEEKYANLREEHEHDLYEGPRSSSGAFKIDEVFSDL